MTPKEKATRPERKNESLFISKRKREKRKSIKKGVEEKSKAKRAKKEIENLRFRLAFLIAGEPSGSPLNFDGFFYLERIPILMRKQLPICRSKL
ncbi:MAG: hypothetical protein R8G66_11815 [Cytophagales bacterium]|nr:hypothetical protein [Cytophagales bacterium]